jgi:hypothetical protein
MCVWVIKRCILLRIFGKLENRMIWWMVLVGVGGGSSGLVLSDELRGKLKVGTFQFLSLFCFCSTSSSSQEVMPVGAKTNREKYDHFYSSNLLPGLSLSPFPSF